MRHIFMNNYQLCHEISDRVIHHFVHCIETHGRHVQYLRFLQTIVRADGKFVKKCQDKVMTEVWMESFLTYTEYHGHSRSYVVKNCYSWVSVLFYPAGKWGWGCACVLQRPIVVPRAAADDDFWGRAGGRRWSSGLSHYSGGAFGWLHWGEERLHRAQMPLSSTFGWYCQRCW